MEGGEGRGRGGERDKGGRERGEGGRWRGEGESGREGGRRVGIKNGERDRPYLTLSR